MEKVISKIKESWRKLKDSIPHEVGRKTYLVLKIIVLTTIFIIIPISFTTLSTLMGASIISSTAYYIVFYIVWALFMIAIIAMTFFAEYKEDK